MKKIIVIVGPTGIGKTKLSIALAKLLNGEIINADSMQIYKGLDIGTSKITKEEQGDIIHHLIDIKEVTESYSVFDYQKDGRKVLSDILERDKPPIVVGGTGLYIKALLYDYKFNISNTDNNYDTLSNEELYLKLKSHNMDIVIDPNNRRRLIRGVINCENNELKTGNNLLYEALFIGLTTDRKTLYEKINNRVDMMLNEGLIKEVKSFYDKNIHSKAITSGIGYKELYLYFNNEISLKDSIDLIKRNSRRYAKRQYTWFNNQMNINWFVVDFNNFNNTINEITSYITNDKGEH
jgi:tRNA dimethylallyltransferase